MSQQDIPIPSRRRYVAPMVLSEESLEREALACSADTTDPFEDPKRGEPCSPLPQLVS